jgi:hypothetical protein
MPEHYEPVITHCPSCRDGVTSQSGIYAYRRAYLCSADQSQWDAADERAHRGGCPHAPNACSRCNVGRAA